MSLSNALYLLALLSLHPTCPADSVLSRTRQYASPSPSIYPTDCPIRLPHHLPVSRQLTPRVVGGLPSSSTTAAYLVALHSPSSFLCSGTLLSSRWVLTAAHCPVNPSLATAYLATTDAGSGFPVQVEQFIFPSQYNLSYPNSLLPRDVALVKLAADAPPNASFALVNSNPNLPLTRAFVRVVGYGREQSGEIFSDNRLRQVDIPVVDWEQCQLVYKSLLTADRLCAGYATGKCDACHGDSGGPLLQFDASGRPVVVGVVHAGRGCAEPNYPAIYMRASSYIQWMGSVGAQFEVASEPQQSLDMSSPVPLEPESSEVPTPSPVPSPTVCPVVLPQKAPDKTLARIVGGSPASNATAQYLATFHDMFGFQCGGVVISAEWVLTTANCIQRANYTLFVGGADAGVGLEAKVQDVFMPSNPASSSNASEGKVSDYAVVRLEKGVSLSNFAWLNSNPSLPLPGAFTKAVGYGNVVEGVRTPDLRLRQVDIPVISNERCRQTISSAMDEVLCAGYENGKCGSCQGDGGGPLLQYDDMGRAVAVGIIWRGVGCARPSSPGVYIRVSSILEWLRETGASFNSTSKAVQVMADDILTPALSPSVGLIIGILIAASYAIAVVVLTLQVVCCTRCIPELRKKSITARQQGMKVEESNDSRGPGLRQGESYVSI